MISGYSNDSKRLALELRSKAEANIKRLKEEEKVKEANKEQMREWLVRNWIIFGAVVIVASFGAAMLTAYLVVLSTIGVNHQNSGPFEAKCSAVSGIPFESRSSGICYDKSGKILFSTGKGGFSGFTK